MILTLWGCCHWGGAWWAGAGVSASPAAPRRACWPPWRGSGAGLRCGLLWYDVNIALIITIKTTESSRLNIIDFVVVNGEWSKFGQSLKAVVSQLFYFVVINLQFIELFQTWRYYLFFVFYIFRPDGRWNKLLLVFLFMICRENI